MTHDVTFTAEHFPQLLGKVISYHSANRMKLPEDPVSWLQNVLCIQNGWGPETCQLVDS